MAIPVSGLAASTVQSNQLYRILDSLPRNPIIQNGVIKGYHILQQHEKPVCTVSGGSDSDVMMDLMVRMDPERRIDFVWCNTGLEFFATRRQIEYLENRYDRPIIRMRPKVNVIQSCRAHGVPFLSKRVSEYLHRLQSIGFDFTDRPVTELLEQYCQMADPERELYLFSLSQERQKKSGWYYSGEGWYRGSVSAILWWCNAYPMVNGDESRYNIRQNQFLKEFLMVHPPQIPISAACCQDAKKDLIHSIIEEGGYDLNIYGVRRAEGGSRATAYHGTCFSQKEEGCDEYRPLYFYTAAEKTAYEQCCQIRHSACYTRYGLKRTGCSCCPFTRNLDYELMVARQFEPQIYKAAWNVFGESYRYTRKYQDFVEKQKNGSVMMNLMRFLGQE